MNLRQNIKTTINIFIQEQQNIDKLNDNFWVWFGNSKIVDNGMPLICYHGTSDKSLKAFDLNKIGIQSGNYGHYGYGFYFSTSITEAKTYGSNILKCYINISNPFTGTDIQIMQLKKMGVSGIDDLVVKSIDFNSFKESFRNNPHIYEFIDNVQKYGLEKAWDIIKDKSNINYDILNDIGDILEYTSLNEDVYEVPSFILDMLKNLNIKPKLNKGFLHTQSLHWITDLGNNSKDVTDVIKRLGYDGVWYGTEIVAFYPQQIKAVNNDGSWDVNDVNIFS